jgi:hypothetical protein
MGRQPRHMADTAFEADQAPNVATVRCSDTVYSSSLRTYFVAGAPERICALGNLNILSFSFFKNCPVGPHLNLGRGFCPRGRRKGPTMRLAHFSGMFYAASR